jgi:hypothetical protein
MGYNTKKQNKKFFEMSHVPEAENVAGCLLVFASATFFA